MGRFITQPGGGGGGSPATMRDMLAMFCWPFHPFFRSNNQIVSYTLDASGKKLALIFKAPKAGSISKLGAVIETLTTSGTFEFRLETVDASNGQPTGTLAAANTNGSLTISAAGHAEVTLTSPYTATRGQMLAAVLVSTGSGSLVVRSADPERILVFPLTNYYNNTSWSKSSRLSTHTVGYSDGTYPHLMNSLSITSSADLNINTGSTPDEVGNVFTMPITAKVAGIQGVRMTGDCDMVIYNSAGTVVATASNDKDINGGSGDATGYYLFASEVTLDRGSTYRVVYKPTTTTNQSITQYVFPSAAIKEQGGYYGMSKTSRTDAGSWTDDTSRVINIGLIISGVLN